MKILITIIIILNGLFAQSQFSGNANFSYANRINDRSILRLPYRMLELKYINQFDNFSLNSEFAFEWNRKMDTDFLEDNNPQDFILDVRELYLTWYIPMGELKIGKQIHSWGFVDENSPLDNLNALDYYYLFDGGASRKLGSYSLASNLYWNNFTFKLVYSPFHNASRMPIVNGQIDPEFPTVIPILPTKDETLEIKNPQEFGINLNYSMDYLDLGILFFTAYDRIFNLAGVNVFGNGPDLSFPFIDIYYGFRKTNMLGLSSSYFMDNLTIRSDFGMFSTEDLNKIGEIATFEPELNDSLHITYRGNEKSDYVELAIQMEYAFTNSIEFLGQIFIYENLNYYSESFPEIPAMPNIPENVPKNINPENLFKPGLGSSLAALSEKSILFQISKTILDDQLKFNFGTLFDFTNKPNGYYDEGELFTDSNSNNIWDENEDFEDVALDEIGLYGKLITFGADYNLSDNILVNINLSKIIGSDYYASNANYQFNLMEDFSNLRLNLKYSF